MDLWIRSQDKKRLIKVSYIDIGIEGNVIFGHITDGYMPLGEYDTENRALEVLDEIQKLMFPPTYIDGCLMISNDNATLLYEMPKE